MTGRNTRLRCWWRDHKTHSGLEVLGETIDSLTVLVLSDAMRGVEDRIALQNALAPEEQALVTQRLARFPLNRLQPRYPWQTVRPRPVKACMADRFA